MNREIKFRVWYPNESKFYYFDLRSISGILGKDAFDEPYTVHQSSGMKDIHGKEIWEGDILFCSKHLLEHRPVVWMKFNVAGFGVEESKKEENQGYFNILSAMNVKQWGLEVVGNIFENPGLLL
jgi:uncharacterized phage protein (TIGR01671 family)